MLGSLHPTPRLPPSWDVVLGGPAPYLRAADLSFLNLEGAISTHSHTTKSCSSCYAFRMPPEAAQALAWAGVDGVSLANNHARDFGDVGYAQTREYLKNSGIQSTGAIGHPPIRLRSTNGWRVSMLAYAPNRGLKDVRDLSSMVRDVAHEKTVSDLVVVSFHAGAEGSRARHTRPGLEMFLGENRGDVISFAKAAIDAGADVVFGHGPHTPRALDVYKGKPIAYSLGNFSTYGGFSLQGTLGLAPLWWVEFNPDKTLRCMRVVSFLQKSPGGPIVDSNHRARQEMMTLTQSDRPETYPTIARWLSSPCLSFPEGS